MGFRIPFSTSHSTSVVSYNAPMLTNPCVLVISSSDVPILLGLRKPANASPYQNLDSCQPATILCNSSIYFFLLTCFFIWQIQFSCHSSKFLSFSQTLMLGCFQGLRYVRACMRNELHGSCGFVRKNFLCLIVSVLFPDFQVVSLFVFLLLYCSHCLCHLFPYTSLLLLPLVLLLCVLISFNAILFNSPAFHLLLSLLQILLHLLQVVLP